MLNSNKAVEREAPLNRALRFASGNAFYYAACAALLVVAAALRFHDLAGPDVHYDEAIDAVQARGSLSEIIESLRCCNTHPIGKSLLLGAAQLASVSEFGIRAPSALAGVLTAGVLVFLLPRVGIGRPAAFLAGLMAALSPPAVLHAREARIYGIDALLAALMIIGLLAYLKNGKKALLCVSLLLAPLTQYGLTLFAAAALATLATAKAIGYFAPQGVVGEANAAPPYDAHQGAGRAALGAVRLCRDMAWPVACFAAGSALTYALTLRYQLSQAERVTEYLSNFYYRSSEAASIPSFLLARIWDMLNYHLHPIVLFAGLGGLCAVAGARFATGLRVHPVVLLLAFSLAAAGAAAAMSVYPLGNIRHSLYLGPIVFAAFAYALYAPSVRFPARARAAWGVSLIVAVAVAGAVNLAERNPYDATRGIERVFAALDAAPAEDAVFVTERLGPVAQFYQGERAEAYAIGDCSWVSVDKCLADMRARTGRVNGSGRIWLALQDNWIVAQLRGWLDEAGAERVAANSRDINLYLIRDRESAFGVGADALQTLPSGEPAARGVWDVYVDGGRLAYLKEPCRQADTEALFFLILVPERVSDLPEERAAAGFEQFDFEFFSMGGAVDGKCVASVPLPEYAVASVRTGQRTREEGELWDAAFPLDPAPYYATYAEAASREPDARAQFNLHIDRAGRTLTFTRTPCAPSDVHDPFFLHVTPERDGDLPEARRASGFDNLGFDFRMRGVVFEDKCAAQVPLPEYAIAGVRTGQYAGRDELWDAALPFDPAPYRAAYAEAASREPDARAYFDLHLDRAGRTLTYTRTPCAPSDIQAPFFLHVTPERTGDLPGGRRVYGYDNLDFDFRIRGAVFDGKCAAQVSLPDYAIASIRTGQFVQGGNQVWKTEFAAGLPAA